MTHAAHISGHPLTKTRSLSESRPQPTILLLLFGFLWSITLAHSQTNPQAKGVFLWKQDAKDTKPSTFSADEYISITQDKTRGEGWLKAEMPSKGFLIPQELFVGFIAYPELAQLDQLSSSYQLDPRKSELQRLVKNLQEYPQTARFLTPRIESLRFEIAQLSAGSIRIAGRWLTLAEQTARDDAKRQRIEAANKKRGELLAEERRLAAQQKREEEQRLAQQQKMAEEQKQNEAREREVLRVELERERVELERKLLAHHDREAQREADDDRAKAIEAQRITSKDSDSFIKSVGYGVLAIPVLWLLYYLMRGIREKQIAESSSSNSIKTQIVPPVSQTRRLQPEQQEVATPSHARIHCPACSRVLRLTLPLQGRLWSCRDCKTRFEVASDSAGRMVMHIKVPANMPPPPPPTHTHHRPWHEVLGVAPGASLVEIKKAKQNGAKQNHPDKLAGAGLSDEFTKLATERMKEINRAFEEAEKAFKERDRTSKARQR